MNKPMHIAQIIEATNAGVARHVFDLVEELAELGHRVEVIYSRLRLDKANQSRLEGLDHWKNVTVHPCDMRRGPHPKDAVVVRHVVKILKKLDSLQLIHGHSTKGGAIARMVGRRLHKPVVYTPNAVRSMDPALPWLAKKLIVRIENYLSHRTAHTIAVSPEEQRHLVDQIRIPKAKTSVIANGINPFLLPSKLEARSELGLDPSLRWLGFVGRLGWQKAPDLLLDAMPAVWERLPDLHLAIVGDGDMGQKLQERVAQDGNGSRVKFLGFRDGQRAMAAFDGFVLPSRYEGLPYVLVEAMYAGLPIIASDQTGCELLVQNGVNGRVYPYDQRTGLADAICDVMSDPDRSAAMGLISKHRSADFTAEKMAEQTLGVYNHLVSNSKHHP
jgi:glycosyltransferase involved in cell wall biosynthesis